MEKVVQVVVMEDVEVEDVEAKKMPDWKMKVEEKVLRRVSAVMTKVHQRLHSQIRLLVLHRVLPWNVVVPRVHSRSFLGIQRSPLAEYDPCEMDWKCGRRHRAQEQRAMELESMTVLPVQRLVLVLQLLLLSSPPHRRSLLRRLRSRPGLQSRVLSRYGVARRAELPNPHGELYPGTSSMR